MDILNRKENFLALCLLEALEDQNYVILQELLHRGASPNTLIIEKDVAPIHYSSGIENSIFAEKSTKLFLEYKGNPNIENEDGLTPLHIACMYGKVSIVKMLLKYGGDILLQDYDKKNPLQYAIDNYHFEVIRIIQNHEFEKKIDRKKKCLQHKILNNNPSKINTLKLQNPDMLQIKKIEENKYTPNRINYNFDITSPYYVNITHRCKNTKNVLNLEKKNFEHSDATLKPTNSQLTSTSEFTDINSQATVIECVDLLSDDEYEEINNLFELTEDNLHEFAKNITIKNSRKSLINVWREKVSLPSRFSILKHYDEIDDILSEFEKSISLVEQSKIDDKLNFSNKSVDASFLTAQDQQTDENFIKTPLDENYFIQVTENYIHTDNASDIIFYEKKVFPNPMVGKSNKDLNTSYSTISTAITIPLEYDTDQLRNELKSFGESPGPITKSTKRLYLRRLVKFKRHPEKANLQHVPGKTISSFSVEIQRTLKCENWNELPEFVELENEMVASFQQQQKAKWREGHLKTSFVYLLIDPRVSENLPGRANVLTKQALWKTFLESIFYVGKGKSSRPYSHLYEAMKYYSNFHNKDDIPLNKNIQQAKIIFQRSNNSLDTIQKNKKQRKLLSNSKKSIIENRKLDRIIDIWKSQKGVICLHFSHNSLPAEAYTREAAIIDCLGLSHLTNLKRGDYYGTVQSWTLRARKQLGIILLYRALQIHLAEGESQLMPHDLV